MQRAPPGPPARSSQQRGPSRRAARGGGCSEMEEASEAVKQLLPDVKLSSRELSQSPKLTKLLLQLTERMDPSGLSLTVKTDLVKTKRDLEKQRKEWLHVEAVQRILDEMLIEYQAKRWGEGVSSKDQQFFQTLEQCLVLGRCCRRLDTRETDGEDSRPSLLGLQREHLQEMLPEARELQAMRQRLLPEVEKRLKERCFSVLCYYQPEYEDNSEVLKMAKSGAMADKLHADKRRVEMERERSRENQITISKQTITYLTLLHRTFELLRELIEKHRLYSQPELDGELEQYLSVKSKAMFAKLGLMKLDLRHQLFNKETVEAHNCIRALLLEQLEKWQHTAESLRGTLSQYQMLGPEFEQLTSEYGRIRELLDNKKWALEEFSKSQS